MGTLRLTHLTKRFRDQTAVDNVNLEIADGEFLVLLGPSGCGKSTLLRLIAGLVNPSRGTIHLDEDDITDVPSRRRNLAMVFQSYALYPHLSVAKNLAFPLHTQRRPRAEVAARVREVAELLQIDQLLARRPKELSGGQRQRVAVGRAIIREPGAFLMDEPLSNLDAKLRTATRHELTRLHRRLESTFIYVTHDQVEAMTMATRIVVMNNGRIEQIGTPSEVYDRPESVFVAGFLGSPPMNLVDVTLRSVAGRVGVVAAGIDLDLWDGETAPRDGILGIRPESLRLLTPSDQPAPVRLSGRVTSVENLGSEDIAYCQVGEATVAVRGPRPLGAVEGEPVTLTADSADVHLFDRASGRRLEWRADDDQATYDAVAGAQVPDPRQACSSTAALA